ncbi:DUF255 domain-containing protein [Marinobacteraceae bacterium S3BR75-40.1]
MQDDLQKERERKRSLYEVRTRHLDERGEPRYANRLIFEDSPYLLQHAHNPVNWYPWGDEAFTKAATEDKPVFLSIGYSTCHWCHVMEEESFDDEEVAEILNRHFVAIKVDREQRPDLDDYYMTAVQLMSGQGGWPMSSFLTPQGKPFFGATYFPKDHFIGLLAKVHKVWDEDRHGLLTDADKLTAGIRQQLTPPATEELPADLPMQVANHLVQNADRRFGGFGDAPKFPQEPNLLLLLEQVQRDSRPLGNQPAWATLKKALDGMLRGGIYDQIGGGFHRYATDRQWLVPHFEKMLYNQGQLAMVYLQAWQLSGDPEYRRIVAETLDYVLREMRSPSGGFYSATDADSEGEEGRFFVWPYQELKALLNKHDLKLCKTVYGVSHSGNFEGANILHLARPLTATSEALGIAREQLDNDLDRIKQLLYEARAQRTPPLRDDKQITEWNGMVIAALARAGQGLERPDYLEAAIQAAEDLWQHHHTPDNGHLWRTTLNGHPSVPAHLEDYAHYLQGLIALYDASGDEGWLHRAITLFEACQARHWDTREGGYFVGPANAPGPSPLRSKSLMDGATISGNSLMLPVMVALRQRTGDVRLGTVIDGQIRAFSGHLRRLPLAGPVFLQGLWQWQSPTPAPLQYLGGGAIRAELVAQADGPQVQARLKLHLSAGWHIQGQDADSEIATRLENENPQAWHVTQIDYPAAEATAAGGHPGYAGEVALTVTATARNPGPLVLRLQLQPCSASECLPVEERVFVVHRVEQNV